MSGPDVLENPFPTDSTQSSGSSNKEKVELYPSSPNTRVQEAIAALDFTTLHAEALSANHMEVLQMQSPPAQNQTTATKKNRDIYKDPDLPLLFGPIFDPLWSPVITKTAAISGYIADLRRTMLTNVGGCGIG